MIRPWLPVIPDSAGNLGMHPLIDRAFGRIDLPMSSIVKPLHAAIQSAARRIVALGRQVGGRGNAQSCMRRRIAQIGKERLLRFGLLMVDNPLLGAGGEQIR